MSDPISKPLPEIPSSPVLRRLTVDANTLISTLIQRTVHEEGLDRSWVDAIKSALAEFGEYVEGSRLIPGLKTARKAQNQARALADAAEREQRRKERERFKDAKAGKGKGNEKAKEKDQEALEVVVSLSEQTDVKLNEIYALTSTHTHSVSPNSSKHLLLTVSPPSDPDLDFEMIPAAKACMFVAESYSFPFYTDEQGKQGDGGTVIFGLDNWKLEDTEASPRIVGGLFTFQHLTDTTVYETLTHILKLSVYIYMSLILEQHVLSNSLIDLQFPTPPSPLSSPIPISPMMMPSPTKQRSRSKAASGIWSFLSRKTEGIIHRVAGANIEAADNAFRRTSSLDLSSLFLAPMSSWRTPPALDENPRPSLTTESVSDAVKASLLRMGEEEERRDREKYGPFMSTARRIQNHRCILSTSPKVIFPPPPLIARLAQREEDQRLGNQSSSRSGSGSSLSSSTSGMTVTASSSSHAPPSLRLTGIEKTGLGNVLGWESRETRGRGMAGTRSFVRHQGLTVLYTEYVVDKAETHACGRPRWVTYRYWARTPAADAERDQTLGEIVERSCDSAAADERCEMEGCDKPRGKHSMNWTCGGVRVRGTTNECSDGADSGDEIKVWQACSVCEKTTEHVKMDDGTYLFSFAKYLELLIWSPLISSLSLCEHITPPSPLTPQVGDTTLSGSRFHIQRHFACKGRVLTFTLTPIHNDIYEIRPPKLQIMSGLVPKVEKYSSEARRKRQVEDERQALEAEIDEWWNGLKIRIDNMDKFLAQEAEHALESKDLPPLPASDDEQSENEAAPSRSRSPLLKRPQAPRSVSVQRTTTDSLVSLVSFHSEKSSGLKGSQPVAPYPPGSPIPIRQSRKLLRKLRVSFQKTQDLLRKDVLETPSSSFNDVRQAFRSSARGAFKRLGAWQTKHTPGAPSDIHSGFATCTEPEWWKGTCHAVPGGRVVVREGEWGSVIAFTLSSLDYQRELANLNAISGPSSSPALSTNIPSEAHSLALNSTIKPIKPPIHVPDPDDNDITSWEESESWTAVITRREHPREGSSLLALRDVLRTKRSFDSSNLGFRSAGSVSRGIVVPPLAWAQPQVQVNLAAADGQVSHFPEAAEAVEKVLESSMQPASHHTETTSSSGLSSSGGVTPTPSSFVERNIRSGGVSTFVSFGKLDENHVSEQRSVPLVAPKPQSVITAVPVPGTVGEQSTPPSSSFSGAFSNAMRYFLSTGPPSRAPSPSQSGAHHGLLAHETTSSIGDRPHIKYDWTIGKRLKFSCTVYYAKQFDALRKRCGVDDTVIKSLERSENWTAVGGKSKSNFWKSSDDRLIIKTLVNAWNVADLQVLIELAPSYFRYIDSTATKASVLAKLMGFYTVEVKNIETGTVQAKHDLLVMENLFYDQKVTKTYDLKGMQSRRAKLNNGGTERRTLFDGEWIDGQQRAPLLIQPHSGYILHEAIKADAEFLAKSNIMDYSLLLGIDEERHEISCGLVDTIGSYTFAKTLEYKAKQNLNSGKGKEVTVIPPGEYHHRFVHSMESYFLTCPDKWTKPPHFIDRTRANDLASVV